MPKTILILEDEKIMLNLLSRQLMAEGYTVHAAEDGEAGLTMMKKIKPDLVLLDIIMPKKDGFGVLEEKQKDKDIKDIPVIIISNSGQPVELTKAQQMGVQDWLIKTEFDPQEVLTKVNKALAKVSPRGEARALNGV